jgi:4-amino-4-deoxy-L-arabinose transferase-like glycosyltransferase
LRLSRAQQESASFFQKDALSCSGRVGPNGFWYYFLMRGSGLVALTLIVSILAALWQKQSVRPLSEFDQPFYLGIAYDLRHSGRFTDGYFFAKPGADGVRPASMRFTPLYPMLLAGVAQVDGPLRANMDCLVEANGLNAACGRGAPIMRALQFAELAGVLWLIWWIAGAVSGEVFVTWASLALALIAAPLLLRSVDYLMTEMTCLLLTTAATAAGLRAVGSRPDWRWAALCGALLGAATLTRPAFFYLVIGIALGGGLIALWRRRGQAVLAAYAGAALLTLAPWYARNVFVLGRLALTYGYASHTLVQRIAFDAMTWREYGMAYVCWLPDGTALGRRIGGAGACDRFGWDAPDSFYLIGQRHLLDETLARAGGYAHHMSFLLHTYVFAMPIWHALVSIPLALRGAYVAHWWGFVLLFFCASRTVLAARRQRRAFLLVALPAWFMLALNAAVAVNQVRYNLMLIPPYALAGGLALHAVRRWMREMMAKRARIR